jgi:hypothetical protein
MDYRWTIMRARANKSKNKGVPRVGASKGAEPASRRLKCINGGKVGLVFVVRIFLNFPARFYLV